MIREVVIQRDKQSGLCGVNITTEKFEEVLIYFADSNDAQVLSDLLQRATNMVVYGVN
jgi:hypothetical protein